MKIAQRIRQARRSAKFSQAQLAERIKVQRSAVSNWESASETRPSMSNLIAIARVCDVSFEWLGTGRGRMPLASDAVSEIPAVDAELVDHPDERELLQAFRKMPQRARALMLNLASELQSAKRRRKT